MVQKTTDNANEDVQTRFIWPRINRPAVMGPTGDGCQVSAMRERFSDFILLMYVSMLDRI
jgi:hypothetical protein